MYSVYLNGAIDRMGQRDAAESSVRSLKRNSGAAAAADHGHLMSFEAMYIWTYIGRGA
jgi:hypothetical protein